MKFPSEDFPSEKPGSSNIEFCRGRNKAHLKEKVTEITKNCDS